jgi:DNA-binding winged helix-turn-helix (wHTH) protein
VAEEMRSLSPEAVVRPPGGEVYAFGRVRVDVARHLVTGDGQPIAIAPKTFELLLILVRSGGRALSRRELAAALWPDTFVEEANLSFQISTLRKALGEGAEAWIETVPKLGYRFTPPVRTEGAAIADATSRLRPAPRPPADDRGQDAEPLLVPPRRVSVTHLRRALAALAVVSAAVLVWRLAIGQPSAPAGPVPTSARRGRKVSRRTARRSRSTGTVRNRTTWTCMSKRWAAASR